ncbi:hypothetical protein [Microvirga sp.]|uniref:antitoxin Xre/MbcA/ParS-like domain-containing protein n=1 Tax=Microvirga sp. TaxID=1873136 RepID=UPI001FEE3FCC|nr:hypothetical protein [Microvirga sp.]
MTEKAIAEMIAAGEVRKAELIDMAGGLYTLSEVAAILAISEPLVEKRRKAGELIAVRLAESYCYPACQFTPHGIVTGLPEVLAMMAIRHDWMRLEWLLVPDEALEGLSPLEALKAGRLEDVIDIARVHKGQDPRQVLSTEDTSGDITDRPLGGTGKGVLVMKGSGLGLLVSLEEGKALLDEITVDDDSTNWAASEILGVARIAEELGTSAATLDLWRDNGTVIAFRKDAHEFVYPERQFEHARPIEGIDRVAGYFPSPEEAWEWLVTPNQYTDSAAPIDRLRSGHIEEVVRAAEGANDYQ